MRAKFITSFRSGKFFPTLSCSNEPTAGSRRPKKLVLYTVVQCHSASARMFPWGVLTFLLLHTALHTILPSGANCWYRNCVKRPSSHARRLRQPGFTQFLSRKFALPPPSTLRAKLSVADNRSLSWQADRTSLTKHGC